MANFLRITLKGTENILKALGKERENQITAMMKAQTKVATEAVRHLKRGLDHDGGRKYPMRYSTPGQLPLRHTGQLLDSIDFKVVRAGKVVKSEVGSGAKIRTAPYAKYLEGRNHNGIRPFLWAVRDLYNAQRVIAYFNKYYKPMQGAK